MTIDTKSLGDLLDIASGRSVKPSYLQNGISRHLRNGIVESSYATVGHTHSLHIGHILGMRPKLKMGWVNAKFVVNAWTIVTNLFSWRNCYPIVKHKAQNVYANRAIRMVVDHSVSGPFVARGNATNPRPAGWSLFDVFPKPLNYGWRKVLLLEKLRRNVCHHISVLARRPFTEAAGSFLYQLLGVWSTILLLIRNSAVVWRGWRLGGRRPFADER